ncbi:MAG: hypothetical protein CUN54_09065 [Phototrophicales bacterium]|nr:MAG: hypothetical protein CUN54_09065 [Phototrophicales bacterium]
MATAAHLDGEARTFRQYSIYIPNIKLPFYVQFMLLMTTIMAIVVIGLALSVKHVAQPQNPFLPHTEISPGQSSDALQKYGAFCAPEIGHSAVNDRLLQECNIRPATGLFSRITVRGTDGVIMQNIFWIRENALVVGDLILLWGQPNIRWNGHYANLSWPRSRISAHVGTEGGYFNYFTPVQHVAFAEGPRRIIP